MRRVATRVTVTAVIAVLFVGPGLGLLGTTSERVSQTAAISVPPQPTATYVSELGPAVMLPPRQPAELPSSGAGIRTDTLRPRAAGLGLAVLGSLLINAALALRPGRAG